MTRTSFILAVVAVLSLWSAVTSAAPNGGLPIERVSVGDNEQQAAGLSLLGFPADGGRYVLFSSGAENLVPGDSNAAYDVFLRDTLSGATTLISVDSTGNESNSDSFSTAISPLGRFILFQSDASDIVAGDGNGETDGFVHDRLLDTTTRVTIGAGGVEGNGFSEPDAITAGGRYVVFRSAATNLVAGDTNGQTDCFMRDRVALTTVRIAPPAAPNPDGPCGDITISPDGHYVAYSSYAGNLVAGDTNNDSDVFVMDMTNGDTRRVSVSSGGAQADDHSFAPSLADSAGGWLVAFRSEATNLVPNDTNGAYDIFVHAMATGQTTIESTSSSGVIGDSDTLYGTLSADGTRLFLLSEASNLVPGDTNFAADAFVRDVATNVTLRISTDQNGGQVTGETIHISNSADGDYAAITSIASDLVPGDTNGEFDVFLIDGSGGGGTPTPIPTGTSTPTGTSIPPTSTVTPTGTVIPPTVTSTVTVVPPTATPTGTVSPPAPTPSPSGTTAPPTSTVPPGVTPTGTSIPPSNRLYLPLVRT